MYIFMIISYIEYKIGQDEIMELFEMTMVEKSNPGTKF